MARDRPPQHKVTRGRYRWALAVVAVSAFMTTMDNTVVFTALPRIMADLGMSSSAKDWVATGYILMFSCLMITGGRLTDLYGCRVTFTTGMAVFTAASAVCGLAHSSEVLILARIVQGGGAALVLPATQVMVTVGRNDKQRSIGNIVFIGAASSATALGPTIGGIIVEHFHWGWIFLINIVPGILVILLGAVVLTGRRENRRARIDLPGVLISATMLFAFIYGLEDGNRHGWTDPSVLSTFALGAIALVCFVVVESWAPDPMIDLRFFRNRVFTGGLLSQMLYGIGFNGMMFYSQPFLQRFLGFSPPEAGLVMLPPAIAIMLLTPVAFLLAAKIGPRPAIGAGMALMGVGMVLFSTLETGDGYADLMPGVLLVGVGAALAMPLVMYVLKAVPEKRAGVASGVINVIREASGAFGIAIVGLLIQTVPDEGASAGALESFREGTSSGLVLGAVLVLIGGVISGLTLPSRRGWIGPKHGKQAPLIAEPEPALAAASTATPRDPLPIVRPAEAAPVPAPLSLRTETETMAAPPTPGPHWWSDAPDDDASAPAWRPAPPDATSPWQDWADTAIPTWTSPDEYPSPDEPSWWTQSAEGPPRPPASRWFDDETAARSRPSDDDPLSTLPGSSPLTAPVPPALPADEVLPIERAAEAITRARTATDPAPTPDNATPPKAPPPAAWPSPPDDAPGVVPSDQAAPSQVAAGQASGEAPDGEDALADGQVSGELPTAATDEPSSAAEGAGHPLEAPEHQGAPRVETPPAAAWPSPPGDGRSVVPSDETLDTAPTGVAGPGGADEPLMGEERGPLKTAGDWAGGEAPGGQGGVVSAGEGEDAAFGGAVDTVQGPQQAGGARGVPLGEPGDAWVAGRGGAEGPVPEVGGPGWPPPPPDGWLYAPYVPEDEEPAGEPDVRPRSDAW
ncbi:DHA2 family efflux MFS transporter permease subunit [Actinomadura opuntiae]|uniref:DHA2 family efflux MFS transporter permease subunit n=1 Tax=Actinomadura sp. OS1-43 TaxID=604315 RepID=UPI00255AA783|nr:DHA2 family efflux MFS transporter permease subunit [Actinomadura sp. OS1-43]MDL4818296.1 DHA2 family efflux MFS transporter permease subunit [Actinomadura sp. OS1-43]